MRHSRPNEVVARRDLDDERRPQAEVDGRFRLRAVGADEAASPPRVRTLVADDDAAMRFLLTTMLSLEADFQVVAEATTGVEAVERVVDGDVDLLVLDLSMPEMDGLEVLRHLSARGAATRIVVYTGLTQDGVEQRARSLGARDVVIKGVSPLELVARLRAAVNGS